MNNLYPKASAAVKQKTDEENMRLGENVRTGTLPICRYGILPYGICVVESIMIRAIAEFSGQKKNDEIPYMLD